MLSLCPLPIQLLSRNKSAFSTSVQKNINLHGCGSQILKYDQMIVTSSKQTKNKILSHCLQFSTDIQHARRTPPNHTDKTATKTGAYISLFLSAAAAAATTVLTLLRTCTNSSSIHVPWPFYRLSLFTSQTMRIQTKHERYR